MLFRSLSWQQQKEEQARQRKLEKELQAVETEIEELESDNEQIDTELSDPANGNDVAKLQKLSKKRAENDARLEELMQRWESLSE